MNKQTLPTEDLKKFGILNTDNSFTKKLKANEVEKFLAGQAIVADNKNNRLVFQLKDNNTQLDVQFFRLDKQIQETVQHSQNAIQYVTETEIPSPNDIWYGDTFKLNRFPEELIITSIRRDENKIPEKIYFTDKNGEEFNIHFSDFQKEAFDLTSTQSLKAFVYDEKTKKVTEYDAIKNHTQIVAILEQKKDVEASNRFKVELLKLKGFLQDKIDKFPSMAKEISVDLNIVSKTILTIDGTPDNTEIERKQNKSKIDLNVNDPDLYQDANRRKEENE